MNKSNKIKFFRSRSVIAAVSNLGLASATPTLASSISGKMADDFLIPHSVNRLDISIDLSISGFTKLKEAADAVPFASGPLKAICGTMVSILELIKRCKENREGWEKLANVMREKNENVVALLKLYLKAPTEYPSAERQAREYQWVLHNIAVDIKKETQRNSEASQSLETYWSRMKSTGREVVLASINAEKIASYQEQIQSIVLDVIENTVIHQALVISDIRADLNAILTDKATLKATTAILKPRPRGVRDFVGRRDILDSMCEAHFGQKGSPSSGDGPIITVLTGMGGSGKTQIAVKFASLFEERFPKVPVFFLDASSEVSLQADLGTLVRSQTDKYDDALIWLANGIEDWLLIMDNADDPSLKLSEFLPQCRHGHVVITTRNATHKLLAPRSTHSVDILSMEDSISLLLAASCSEDNEVNRSFARDIAEELGRLPLALAHAAAYILVNDCLNTFTATYSASRDRFLKSVPNLPQNYPHSIERTIEMSFHCLSPKVQEMIQLFAYMESRSIALCIIERAAERKFLHIPQKSQLPPHPNTIVQAEILQSIFCPSGEWKSFEFDEMIGECLKYSLLQFSTADGEKFYSIHPLVQKYLQTASKLVQDHSPSQLVARVLASATTCSDRWNEFFGFNRLLGPHVRLVRLEEITEAGDHFGIGWVLSELQDELSVAHLERCVEIWKASHDSDEEGNLDAMELLAISYQFFGREEEALVLREEVLERRKSLLGPDHRDTLDAMSNVADSYSSIGKAQDALLLQEEVLEKRKRLLGLDHFTTLNTMTYVASCYESIGRAREALLLEEEVLEKKRRLLGSDHPETLDAMAQLASTYSSIDSEKEALPLYEEVLEKKKRLLGPDHLETLTIMGNLANAYRVVGREQDAVPLEEEVLGKRKRLLGVDHPHTLIAMGHLASSYSSVNRAKEALSLYEEILEKRKRLLGPDHPDTLATMDNLANSYRLVGRTQDALLLEEEVLEKKKCILGPDHLETLTMMGNLANKYRLLGRAQDAVPLEEEVLEKRRRLLGVDHPHTLIAMACLASSYSSIGRTKEASSLYEEILETKKRLLGPDHLEILEAMTDLASSYSSIGRSKEALSLYEEILETKKRLLGPDHLETLIAMGNLADRYRLAGRTQDALSLQKEVLEARKRLLGVDHPHTLIAMGHLASSYSSTGNAKEAVQLYEEALEKGKRILGPDHLQTLTTMGNLANNYRLVGRAQDALPLEEEVLEKRKRLLGSAHPHTLLAMYCLLITLRALNKEKELKDLAEVALPLHEKVYGLDHKDTVWIRGLLK